MPEKDYLDTELILHKPQAIKVYLLSPEFSYKTLTLDPPELHVSISHIKYSSTIKKNIYSV